MRTPGLSGTHRASTVRSSVVAVEEAKKTYRTLERVGDVLEDYDEANGVEKTAPPSPFALPDTNGGFKGWVTYSHPTTGGRREHEPHRVLVNEEHAVVGAHG